MRERDLKETRACVRVCERDERERDVKRERETRLQRYERSENTRASERDVRRET